MRQLDSLVMAAAAKAEVPAGSALAVDRDIFSAEVEAALAAQPTLEVVREREVAAGIRDGSYRTRVNSIKPAYTEALANYLGE